MFGSPLQKKASISEEDRSFADKLGEYEAMALAESGPVGKRSAAPKADSLAKLLVQALHRYGEGRWGLVGWCMIL